MLISAYFELFCPDRAPSGSLLDRNWPNRHQRRSGSRAAHLTASSRPLNSCLSCTGAGAMDYLRDWRATPVLEGRSRGYRSRSVVVGTSGDGDTWCLPCARQPTGKCRPYFLPRRSLRDAVLPNVATEGCSQCSRCSNLTDLAA
jgi:hypothetical protein